MTFYNQSGRVHRRMVTRDSITTLYLRPFWKEELFTVTNIMCFFRISDSSISYFCLSSHSIPHPQPCFQPPTFFKLSSASSFSNHRLPFNTHYNKNCKRAQRSSCCLENALKAIVVYLYPSEN